MNLLFYFLLRRWWIFRKRWFSDALVTFLIPMALYLSVLGFHNLLDLSLNSATWTVPGLTFVVILIASFSDSFVELFKNRKIGKFFESIVVTPSPSHLLFTAVTISILVEAVIKGIVSAIILQILSRNFQILSILFLIPFMGILAFLLINLATTLMLLSKWVSLTLIGCMALCIFIIIGSGWLTPLSSFDTNSMGILYFLPTTLLMKGGQLLYIHHELEFISWFIPLLVSFLGFGLNIVLFKKVVMK